MAIARFYILVFILILFTVARNPKKNIKILQRQLFSSPQFLKDPKGATDNEQQIIYMVVQVPNTPVQRPNNG